MNYFFGYSDNIFFGKLTIPKFNNLFIKKKILLLKVTIKDNVWDITQDFDYEEKENFYIINNVDTNSFFTLLTLEELKKFDKNKLIDISKFTNTKPAFRSNFQIKNKLGGYSSYQLEYPFGMTKLKSGIISIVNSLIDNNSQKKYILFRNIYYEPIIKEFEMYLIDLESNKILKKFYVKTNTTNLIKLENLSGEVILVSKSFVGIPIYINEYSNGMISMEHTHPPHSYLYGKDKHLQIKKLKNRIFEIV